MGFGHTTCSWALAGDAGLVLDPISAHGISNAFRDAELLADAIISGLGGGGSPHRGGLDAALAAYQRQRDRAARPLYDLTARNARLGPRRIGERMLYSSLAGQPAEISRFYGVLAGTEPAGRYLTPGNLARIVGRRPWTGRSGRRRASLAGACQGRTGPVPPSTATPTRRGR